MLALLTDSSLPPNISGGPRPGLNLGGLDQYDISSGALGSMPQRQPVPGSLQRPQIPGQVNQPVSHHLLLSVLLNVPALIYIIMFVSSEYGIPSDLVK